MIVLIIWGFFSFEWKEFIFELEWKYSDWNGFFGKEKRIGRFREKVGMNLGRFREKEEI